MRRDEATAPIPRSASFPICSQMRGLCRFLCARNLNWTSTSGSTAGRRVGASQRFVPCCFSGTARSLARTPRAHLSRILFKQPAGKATIHHHGSEPIKSHEFDVGILGVTTFASSPSGVWTKRRKFWAQNSVSHALRTVRSARDFTCNLVPVAGHGVFQFQIYRLMFSPRRLVRHRRPRHVALRAIYPLPSFPAPYVLLAKSSQVSPLSSSQYCTMLRRR